MSEFFVREAQVDATDEIVTPFVRVYLLGLTSFHCLSCGFAKGIAKLVRRAAQQGARFLCLTLQLLYLVTYHDLGSVDVRCYNVDASTMATRVRGNNGILGLQEGLIRPQQNFRYIRP